MKLFLVFFLCLPLLLNAQYNEYFTDDIFSTDPVWQGDTTRFVINGNQELQLADSAKTGESMLATASAAILDASWSFRVKMDFNPSSSNYCKFYLLADSANFNHGSGYFVKIGNTPDEISLYRQDTGNETLIIDGKDDRVDMSEVICRVKVTRDSAGTWQLFSDTTGGTNYQLEGSCFDNNRLSGNWSGIDCIYTSTRWNKFYFDSLEASGEKFMDTTLPVVDTVTILSGNEIAIRFSENIDPASLDNSRFTINDTLSPESFFLLDDSLYLKFPLNFPHDQHSILSGTGLTDNFQNAMLSFQHSFYHYQPQPRDVVINEIMADPEPPVNLPPFEYIELYNQSPVSIQLENWEFNYGSNSKKLEPFNLASNEYLVISNEEGCLELKNTAPCMGVFTAATSLANDGAAISLLDDLGNEIDYARYDKEWYQDSFKEEGGWSLERIDPARACGGNNNWSGSLDKSGGTPGEKNSVYDPNPDPDAPQVTSLLYLNDSSLMLTWNEQLDTSILLDPGFYVVDEGIGRPVDIEIAGEARNQVVLMFPALFSAKTIYSLSIDGKLTDCNGNVTPGQTLEFGKPEDPVEGELLISEVLFNPYIDGSDFVEVHNLSNKIMDMGRIYLGNTHENTGEIQHLLPASTPGILLFPGEYLAVTESKENIEGHYYPPPVANIAEAANLPSYPDDKGTVMVSNRMGEVLDKFLYDQDMHHPLVKDPEGISLERLSFNEPTNKASNWQSTPGSYNHATPGYANSVLQETSTTRETIKLSSDIFSPDNDGHEDLLEIYYSFDQDGHAMTITVFDAKGRKKHHLAQNEVVSSTGTITWNGTGPGGNLLPPGIYILFIETFETGGKVEKFKKTVVITY